MANHKNDHNSNAHNAFRRSELDTVASSARRIFLCEGGLFRDGPDQKHGTANVKTQKRQKKANR